METIELTTTVLPGGRIEVIDPRLMEGEGVRLRLEPIAAEKGIRRETISELLAHPLAPEDRCFKSVEEMDAAIEEERNAWDREN